MSVNVVSITGWNKILQTQRGNAGCVEGKAQYMKENLATIVKDTGKCLRN